jgi:hypothetical protein
VTSRDELYAALSGALRTGGPRLVEVKVAPGMSIL